MQNYNDPFVYTDPFAAPEPIFDEDGSPVTPPTKIEDLQYESPLTDIEDELPF